MRKQLLISVLLLPLCLLCACAGKEIEPLEAPMAFRAALLERGGCRFELEALAQAGEELWPLTLACDLDASGGGTVTVLAPESIAGVCARLEGEKGTLEYEDLALALGRLPDSDLAPAAAPGVLVRAWARDWIASAGPDGEDLLACYQGKDLEIRTWFDAGGLPLRAELALDGEVRFQGDVKNFAWKEDNPRP